MVANIVRELEQIASRRKRLADVGQRLVQKLNRVLPELGYQVVATGDAPAVQESAPPRPVTALERRKRLQCPECDRTFGQPMNLGRHLAATHRKKGSARQARRSRGRGKKAA